MVLIDAVNEGINEGCDHADSDGGVDWFSGWDDTTLAPSNDNEDWFSGWDTTLAPSNDNTYAATSPWTWDSTHGHGTGNTDGDGGVVVLCQ